MTTSHHANDKFLVDRREAARLLSFCESQIAKMTRRGELPCVRVGRAVRYSPADLKAWIERQKGVAPLRNLDNCGTSDEALGVALGPNENCPKEL